MYRCVRGTHVQDKSVRQSVSVLGFLFLSARGVRAGRVGVIMVSTCCFLVLCAVLGCCCWWNRDVTLPSGWLTSFTQRREQELTGSSDTPPGPNMDCQGKQLSGGFHAVTARSYPRNTIILPFYYAVMMRIQNCNCTVWAEVIVTSLFE